MLPDVLCEPFVQRVSLFFENPRSDCDSSSSQPFETFAAHRRIGRRQPNALARKVQSATKKCFIGLSLGSHELCIISPQGLTGTDRSRLIESVAGRSGKNPLQVRPQPRHCGLTGQGEQGQACSRKDRPELGVYHETAARGIPSLSLLDVAARDVVCQVHPRNQVFHESSSTQTTNRENP